MHTETTLYKVLSTDGKPHYGGRANFKWPLPNGEPGAWKAVTGELVPCAHGLHLCRRSDLVHWLGPTIWIAEHDGEKIEQTDKLVVRKARLIAPVETWNETTARLFAADCAEIALTYIPETHRAPFVAAINAARGFARGEITAEQMAAAGDAAWAAAWAAARAVQTELLFDYIEGRRS